MSWDLNEKELAIIIIITTKVYWALELHKGLSKYFIRMTTLGPTITILILVIRNQLLEPAQDHIPNMWANGI